MNFAQKLAREFDLIPRTRDGFCFSVILDGFLERCEFFADSVEYPYGTDSYDAIRLYRFPDGSGLWVSNPNQALHAAFVDMLKEGGGR